MPASPPSGDRPSDPADLPQNLLANRTGGATHEHPQEVAVELARLGLLLAERSRFGEGGSPADEDDRTRAVSTLRQALALSALEEPDEDIVALELAHLLVMSGPEGPEDEPRTGLDTSTITEAVALLRTVAGRGDAPQREAAFELGLVALGTLRLGGTPAGSEEDPAERNAHSRALIETIALLARSASAAPQVDALDEAIVRCPELDASFPESDPHRGEFVQSWGELLTERASRRLVEHAGVMVRKLIPLRMGMGDSTATLRDYAPDAAADLDQAVEVLRSAVRLSDQHGEQYDVVAGKLGKTLMFQHLLTLPTGDRGLIRESTRLLRIGIEHSPDGLAALPTETKFALLGALVQHVWITAPFGLQDGGPDRMPDTPNVSGFVSVEEDLRLLERLIEAELERTTDPLVLTAAALLAHLQGPARRPDYVRHLRTIADRPVAAGDGLGFGLLARFFLFAEKISDRDMGTNELTAIWAKLVDLTGDITGGRDLGDALGWLAPNAIWQTVLRLLNGESLAASWPGALREQLAGLGSAAEGAGVTRTERAGSDRAASEPAAATGRRASTADPSRDPEQPGFTPIAEPAPDIDLRAAVLIGDGSVYPFAGPAGQVATVAAELEGRGHPGGDAVLPAVRAVAHHRRWLLERDGRDLTAALLHTGRALGAAEPGSALALRVSAFFADLLLDRYLLLGDRADLESARDRYRQLLERSETEPDSPGLLLLLSRLCETEGFEPVRAVFLSAAGTTENAVASNAAGCFRGEMLASLGEVELLLTGTDDRAVTHLEEAFKLLPRGHSRLPAAESELARIQAARAMEHGDWSALDRAAQTLLDAAATSAPDSPHRPALMLRAAGVLVGCATAGVPDVHGRFAARLDVAIEQFEAAAREPGRGYHGARARYQYGLGCLLHVRHLERNRDLTLLGRAVEAFSEALTTLGHSPGDPFVTILQRALASAHRAFGPGDTAHRRRSRETAESVLASHREAVLLQSGTVHGLGVAGLVDEDMKRLVRWCLKDREWTAAVKALELGRGLVLHSATVAADVPSLLRAAGHGDLADRWSGLGLRSADSPESVAGLLAVPDDLRRSVLAVIEGTVSEPRLLAVPTPAEIGAALCRVGADMFVHLVMGTSAGPGYALITGETGDLHVVELPGLRDLPDSALAAYARTLEAVNMTPELPQIDASQEEHDRYEAAIADAALESAAWESALETLCRWAGSEAMQQILDHVRARTPGRIPRLVLAPSGMLGVVPWHAAWVAGPDGPGSRHLCQEAVISHCATAGQFIEAASRRPQPLHRRQAMVVDPSGSSPMHSEARLFRRVFYQQATVIGSMNWSDRRDGPWTGPPSLPATREALLPWLPGHPDSSASLLIVNCHGIATTAPAESHLLIDGRTRTKVTVEQLLADSHLRHSTAPGGTVILNDCSSDLALASYDESLTLATSFIAAGASTVVGARWPIDDGGRTAMFMYMFHHFLNGRPNPSVPEAAGSPVDAIRAAQCWMLDAHRTTPAEVGDAPFAQENPRWPFEASSVWAAFTHHGR